MPQKITEMVSDPSWQHCVVEQQFMLLKCTPYKKTLLVPSKSTSKLIMFKPSAEKFWLWPNSTLVSNWWTPAF